METSIIDSVENIFNNAYINKKKRKKLTFDCEKLNNFFDNGIINNSLIEILGKNGSGKTQFALTLCAEQLLKYYINEKKKIILYIYVNRYFPIERLIEIIENKKKNIEYFKNENFINNENIYYKDEYMKEILQNLYIRKIKNEKDFCNLFKKEIYRIFNKYNVSILIIDSFDSIFNTIEKYEYHEKLKLFTNCSLILKNLLYKYNFFVFLLNTSYNKDENLETELYYDYNSFIIPTFSNTKFLLKKNIIGKKNLRKIIIQHSEFIYKYKIENFKITNTGFELL